MGLGRFTKEDVGSQHISIVSSDREKEVSYGQKLICKSNFNDIEIMTLKL